jgi:hypothetical protein
MAVYGGKHPFFSIPGVGMKTMAVDPTHTLDLGVSKDLIGSLFHLCVYGKRFMPDGTIIANFQALARRLQEFYIEHPGISSRIAMPHFHLQPLKHI